MAVLIKSRLRQSNRNKPLIMYEVLVYLQPPLLIGTTFGIELFKILPEWLTLALTVILLGVINYLTWKRGIFLYK